MPRRYVKFVKGNFYHVYNRAKNQQKIFYESDNYLYLLRLLKNNTKKHTITIIAYCLMPNHYHFLMRVDGYGDLSRCVSTTWNSYVQAFNKKFNRSGSLCDDRFKAIHVDRETYLIYLCRYIHRNPLKANLVSKLEQWPFSNYMEFVGKRKGNLYDATFFQIYFGDSGDYHDFVYDDAVESPSGFDDYILD